MPLESIQQITPEHIQSELLPVDRLFKQGTDHLLSRANDDDATHSLQSSTKRQQLGMMSSKSKAQKPLTSKDTSIQVRVSNTYEAEEKTVINMNSSVK